MSPRRLSVYLAIVSLTISAPAFAQQHRAAEAPIATPTVSDPNLQLSLLASEPDVVTPVALAADVHGRLYVAETHTHARNSRYDGPDSDRILVFEDTDGDGQLDRQSVYADNLKNVLSMAFASDGTLYVLQMKEALILRDADNDGVSESRTSVLNIETPNNNHHGVFLALALDDRDRMYVSLGNISGNRYVIQGSDGSEISGQGDTGLIIRAAADGSAIDRFAHGFWNPCDLKFDAAGRLLATDNDPDARGPNRVLHVMGGGRYGYRSRFGPSGLHAYDSWNGELPGTLPMLAGVGEAPVGVLDCKATSLPVDYDNSLLVCVWGTNEVVRVRTSVSDGTISGRMEPLIKGNRDFRPTGITATSDGTVYFGDWADRRYPVHGKGRIWRLRAASAAKKRLTPALPFSAADTDQHVITLRNVAAMDDIESFSALVDAARLEDPFIASAARKALARDVFRDELRGLLASDDPETRLAALLSLRDARATLDPAELKSLLTDSASDVRRMTMIWLGETMRMDLVSDLRQSLSLQTRTPALFETFLATSQMLTQAERDHIRAETPGTRIDRSFPQQLLLEVLADPNQPGDARVMAVRYLDDTDLPGATATLMQLALGDEEELACAAIHSLGSKESTAARLSAIALDKERPVSVRCDAIMAVAAVAQTGVHVLRETLTDENVEVALTAARAATGQSTHVNVQEAIKAVVSSPGLTSDEVRRQLAFALRRPANDRPKSDPQWLRATMDGDANAGRRVFFDTRLACVQCHRREGRGGIIGPDLTNVSAAKTRQQILTSILHPSQDRSPDYQGYLVLMQDGKIHRGAQFHFRGESADLLTIDGNWIRFKLDDTEDYRPLETSLMPEDLVDSMSVSELRDLMAYLTQ